MLNKISDRTYVNFDGQEINHIDHLVINRKNILLRQANEDISWKLYLDNQIANRAIQDIMEIRYRIPPRNIYPQHIRQPVKLYGIDN